MYFKFKSNNVNEVAILALYAGEKPLGAIGISFADKTDGRLRCRQGYSQVRYSGSNPIIQLTSQHHGNYQNILTAILKWLGSIPSDKLLHLIAGAVIAAFSPLSFPIRLKYASYSPPSQGWQRGFRPIPLQRMGLA